MANKRQLTGGTDDVNPQFLSATLTLTAANTTSQLEIITPINRVGGDNSGTATVMEILKIFVNMPDMDGPQAAAILKDSAVLAIGTSNMGLTTLARLSDPKVIAYFGTYQNTAFTAGGSGVMGFGREPFVMDLTDGAGHGLLVATDTLYAQGQTSNQTNASSFGIKFLYRFKRVKLVEYIGIVQSQQ